ncbi:hypothetical protein G7K_5568-t1 [Saitoella complicata NRRL Y-17804]|uniref:Uncharacterized protein n=1 Tax=Saitoella complicata (strain BCRC 22490 / CBS 7301 / JCM 7358 / NBRC 10748 / NRRL Y-17804) TaxID=698492 RepID=A0A0E9NNU5_SAICN|nr:hypothetical protein G7K_5568-t1 [Saitoella complicata NRRL Y-17804]
MRDAAKRQENIKACEMALSYGSMGSNALWVHDRIADLHLTTGSVHTVHILTSTSKQRRKTAITRKRSVDRRMACISGKHGSAFASDLVEGLGVFFRYGNSVRARGPAEQAVSVRVMRQSSRGIFGGWHDQCTQGKVLKSLGEIDRLAVTSATSRSEKRPTICARKLCYEREKQTPHEDESWLGIAWGIHWRITSVHGSLGPESPARPETDWVAKQYSVHPLSCCWQRNLRAQPLYGRFEALQTMVLWITTALR